MLVGFPACRIPGVVGDGQKQVRAVDCVSARQKRKHRFKTDRDSRPNAGKDFQRIEAFAGSEVASHADHSAEPREFVAERYIFTERHAVVFVEIILYRTAGFGDQQSGIVYLVFFRGIAGNLKVDAADEERHAMTVQQFADTVAVFLREFRTAAIGVGNRGFRPHDQVQFPVRSIADRSQIPELFIAFQQLSGEREADVERFFCFGVSGVPALGKIGLDESDVHIPHRIITKRVDAHQVESGHITRQYGGECGDQWPGALVTAGDQRPAV